MKKYAMKINNGIIVENGNITFLPKSFETLKDFCKSQFTVLYVKDEKEKYIDIANCEHAIDKNILKNTGYSNVISQYVYNKIRFHYQ
jgi:hypothetical protein